MSLRKEFVLQVIARDAPVAELCREYGISRKTAYKWIQRFRDRGVRGLANESRRPDSSPNKTTAEVVNEIVALRREHPTWGPKKLRRLLTRTRGEESPSEKTIERVLREQGLVRKRNFRRPSVAVSTRAPKVAVDAPNDLWTVDFKGWWRTHDGARCEPLTVRDAYSRQVLCLRVLEGTAEHYVRPAFESLFERFGLPKAIQSDNGPPFACTQALGGLTRLSAWWVALGIEVVRSRPGCPQDNGGHERMHVDVWAELEKNSAPNLLAQQSLFDDWVAEFNHVRPHEALRMLTPAEVYRRSERRLASLVVPSYPKHWTSKRVGSSGKFEHRGRKIYASTVLARHVLGLEELPGRVQVWFYDLLLGSFVAGRDDKVSPPEPEGVTVCNPTPVGSYASDKTSDPDSSELGGAVLW